MATVEVVIRIAADSEWDAEWASGIVFGMLGQNGVEVARAELRGEQGDWSYHVELPAEGAPQVEAALLAANGEFERFGARCRVKQETASRDGAKAVVVNMFGGPGAGKTTAAMEVASKLKKAGYVVEYVPEYAKELAWRRNDRTASAAERDRARRLLDGKLMHQQAIWEEQHGRVQRLVGQCDFVVTDSPALLSCIYVDDYRDEPGLQHAADAYKRKWLDLFMEQANFNMFVERSERYESEGRVHTEAEALAIDVKTKEFLSAHKIYYGTYDHGSVDRAIENMQATYERLHGVRAESAEKGNAVGIDAHDGKEVRKMAEEQNQETQEKQGSGFEMDVPVSIPAAYVNTPFPATRYDTGEPIVSKSGNQLYKAYATIPKGTTANGVDIGGYEIVVNYGWGEKAKAAMDSRKASGDRLVFDLGQIAENGKVYLKPPTDREGNALGEPLRIDAWEVTKAVKASREAFIASKEAARAEAAVPNPREDAIEAAKMAEAQSKSAPSQEKVASR